MKRKINSKNSAENKKTAATARKNIMQAATRAGAMQTPGYSRPGADNGRKNAAPRSGAELPAAPDSSVRPAGESAKTAFLRALPRAGGVAHAIKESGIEPCLLYYCLEHDEAFRREFDRAVNTKLELELIDRTLEGKPAGLFSFTLPARMPEKYDAKYDQPQDATPPVVVYEAPKSARKTAGAK
ncbi:MAG: hypothetical protein PHW69_09420 [Elusimicrobiaceae bacterium]|nr:hypothetical protein [Elusimicrobiaceae bacterium]